MKTLVLAAAILLACQQSYADDELPVTPADDSFDNLCELMGTVINNGLIIKREKQIAKVSGSLDLRTANDAGFKFQRALDQFRKDLATHEKEFTKYPFKLGECLVVQHTSQDDVKYVADLMQRGFK